MLMSTPSIPPPKPICRRWTCATSRWDRAIVCWSSTWPACVAHHCKFGPPPRSAYCVPTRIYIFIAFIPPRSSANNAKINFREKEKKVLDQILGQGKYDARIRPSGLNGTGKCSRSHVNQYRSTHSTVQLQFITTNERSCLSLSNQSADHSYHILLPPTCITYLSVSLSLSVSHSVSVVAWNDLWFSTQHVKSHKTHTHTHPHTNKTYIYHLSREERRLSGPGPERMNSGAWIIQLCPEH